MAEGLPSNTVLALCQDSRGFLWIGTDEGITTYDGVRFRSITTSDGLPWSRVSDIIESKKLPGTIWVGTHGGGIAQYREGSTSVFQHKGDQVANTIDGIVEDTRGKLWAVSHGGIFQISGDSLLRIFSSTTYTGGDITMTSDGTIWAGIDNTLFAYSGDSLRGTFVLDMPPEATIVSMLGDRSGNLWVGTASGFLFRLSSGRVVGKHRFGTSGVSAIWEDNRGEIFISVWGGGVRSLRIVGAGFDIVKKYTIENGMVENNISAVLVDREENLWFGSANNGLFKLSEPSFYKLDLPGIKTHHNGFADDYGHLWFASTEGIWELWRSDGLWRKHLHQFPWISGQPTHIRNHRSRGIWVGFDNGSITYFSIHLSKTGASTLHPQEQLEQGVDVPKGIPLPFLVDSRNRIWRSYQPDPLVVLEREEKYRLKKAFTVSEGYPVNSVRILFEDKQGNLWFGTFSAGLMVLPYGDWRNERFITITMNEGLPDNGIRALFQDSNGTLWIGLRHGGLASIGGFGVDPLTAVLQRQPFRVINRSDGLLSNAVWDIAEDEAGRLWCATSAGIQYIIPDSTVQVGGISEFFGFSTGTVGVLYSETLWALGRDAFLVYDFPQGARDTIAPPIYISRIVAAGREMVVSAPIELAPDQNTMTIEFVGISLRQEQMVRYQYRLLENQLDWEPLTHHNRVTYAGLSPGKHTFEVRAINSNGVMSHTPATLAFTILAPIYMRWWFLGLALLALLSLTAIIVWTRARHLLAIERIRSRIATDLHDDIGASLTRIAVFSTAAQQELKLSPLDLANPHQSSSRLKSLLTDITSTSRDLTDAMSDVVWSVDPRNDSFDQLLLRMKTYAGRVLEARGIEYDIDIPPSVAALDLPLDFRRNFLLIFKEALNNAIRHSGASHVQLRMDSEHG